MVKYSNSAEGCYNPSKFPCRPLADYQKADHLPYFVIISNPSHKMVHFFFFFFFLLLPEVMFASTSI